MARHLDGVGSGCLVDADGGRGRAVEAAVAVLRLCAHFNPRDMLDPEDGAIGIGGQDDGGEFLWLREPPLSFDVDLDLLLGRDRRGADAAQRRLNVLTLDRGDHVVRRQIELGQAVRVEPDAQRIVERPEQRCLPNTFDARQWIYDVDRRVVAQINGIVGALRRIEVDDLQQRGGFLADGEAVARDLSRQLRNGETGAVLHVDGVDVGIRAQREGHRQDVTTIRGAGGLVIERVVDAVDLLLDRLRHGRFDHLGIGARIARVECNLRRYDVRELRDRDRENRDDAGKRDDDGDDDGKPRPLDENAGKHQVPGTTVVVTTWPGRTFWMPSTMTSSPSLRPSVTTTFRPCSTPVVTRRCSIFLAASTTRT